MQDADFRAMRAVQRAIEPLDPRARVRVIAYVLDRLGLGVISVSPAPPQEDAS